MGDRIRQLEDALAVLQASNSREQHPLLRDGLLSIDEKLEPPPAAEDEEAEEPTEAVVNAFGTMSIMDHGVSRFFGPTGGPEGLLLVSAGLPFLVILADSDPVPAPTRSTVRTTSILQIQIQAAAPNPHPSIPKSPASRSPSPSRPWAPHTKSTR